MVLSVIMMFAEMTPELKESIALHIALAQREGKKPRRIAIRSTVSIECVSFSQHRKSKA